MPQVVGKTSLERAIEDDAHRVAVRRLRNQHDGLAKARVGHVRLRHEQHAVRRAALACFDH